MGLFSVLVGCADSTKSVDIGLISPAVLAECPELPIIPEKNLDMAEVEGYWINDRVEYIKCAKKHKELATTVKERAVKK